MGKSSEERREAARRHFAKDGKVPVIRGKFVLRVKEPLPTDMSLSSIKKLNPMGDIKRTCTLCKEDQTPKGKGLTVINDRRGTCLGLFCDRCYPVILEGVNISPRAYRNNTAEIRSTIYREARRKLGLPLLVEHPHYDTTLAQALDLGRSLIYGPLPNESDPVPSIEEAIKAIDLRRKSCGHVWITGDVALDILKAAEKDLPEVDTSNSLR